MMNDKDRNLQHAMMSFAYWGGILVNPRPGRAGTPFRLSDLVPRPRRKRA